MLLPVLASLSLSLSRVYRKTLNPDNAPDKGKRFGMFRVPHQGIEYEGWWLNGAVRARRQLVMAPVAYGMRCGIPQMNGQGLYKDEKRNLYLGE